VPGVGRKLAARTVLELKEKVAAAGVAAGGGAAGGESEVVAALLALGYSAGEAREASREALTDLTAGSGLEDRVKAALRTLLKA
jgi:Holliday junction DNA helicase RuvA